MRCLRKLKSFRALDPMSLPVFWPHFRTIIEIHIRDPRGETPGLWKEVMSSCPL